MVDWRFKIETLVSPLLKGEWLEAEGVLSKVTTPQSISFGNRFLPLPCQSQVCDLKKEGSFFYCYNY
jgi:hypothetical protein